MRILSKLTEKPVVSHNEVSQIRSSSLQTKPHADLKHERGLETIQPVLATLSPSFRPNQPPLEQAELVQSTSHQRPRSVVAIERRTLTPRLVSKHSMTSGSADALRNIIKIDHSKSLTHDTIQTSIVPEIRYNHQDITGISPAESLRTRGDELDDASSFDMDDSGDNDAMYVVADEPFLPNDGSYEEPTMPAVYREQFEGVDRLGADGEELPTSLNHVELLTSTVVHHEVTKFLGEQAIVVDDEMTERFVLGIAPLIERLSDMMLESESTTQNQEVRMIEDVIAVYCQTLVEQQGSMNETVLRTFVTQLCEQATISLTAVRKQEQERNLISLHLQGTREYNVKDLSRIQGALCSRLVRTNIAVQHLLISFIMDRSCRLAA